MTYKEAAEFVAKADENAGEMGLEAIGTLLKKLGNPERELTFVHVGGTNGKGSVSAYIAFILAAAGYKVGRYISPTLRHYRERIQCLEWKEGKPDISYISEKYFAIETEKLSDVYEKMKQVGDKLPSAFELETALGFLYFKDCHCDVVMLEVGMGGRRDATNIIPKSVCTVFASISMDHMNVLGNSLSQITREKAGIIKSKGDVVAYDYRSWCKERGCVDTISPVLEMCIEEKDASLRYADFTKLSNVQHSIDGIRFDYGEDKQLVTPILGENQVKNAALALECVYLLKKKGWSITKEAVYEGMRNVVWEGRFQVVWEHPYYIVDGAHNEDAARSLAASVNLYVKNKKMLCIVGILSDKEYKKVLGHVAPLADKIITVTPDSKRALPATDCMEAAKEFCPCVEVGETVEHAMDMAQQEEKNYDVVLIFGSLYYLHRVYDYLERRKKE